MPAERLSPTGLNRLLAWRLGLRDLRGPAGGLRGFRLFLACLVLGVGAVAAAGSLTAAIQTALQAEGTTLLGGDLDVTLTGRQPSARERAAAESLGRTSEVISLRTMAASEAGTGTPGGASQTHTLIELKAVDDSYPLTGQVGLQGAATLAAALKQTTDGWGAAISPDLAARLGLRIGDGLQIGDTRYRVRALIAHEPGGALAGLDIAPPVIVALPSLASTKLLARGSLLHDDLRIMLKPGLTLATARARLQAASPHAGWRIRDRNDASPGLKDFITRLGLFLSLSGLTTLAIGGIGAGNAVRAHLEKRIDTIATLKVLGARTSQVVAIYGVQIAAVAGVGILAGLVLGALAPMIAHGLLAAYLPVAPAEGFYPAPLALAAAYGALVTAIFALIPLGRAAATPAASLYRRDAGDAGPTGRQPGARHLRRYLGVTLLAVLATLALMFSVAAEARLAAGFSIGIALGFALLAVTGLCMRLAAARAPRPHHPAVRLALGNLARPGGTTVAIVVSLGLGLTLFAAVAAIEANLTARVTQDLPGEAPAFFFVDIQKDELAGFKAAARSLPGVHDLVTVPYLRGRITRLNGVPVAQADVAPDSRWAIEGDRGLTWATQLPKGNRLAGGEWWPPSYAGPPEISLDTSLARGMGLKPGDTLTVNIMGRPVTARIASLRDIDWGTMGVNFAIIFDPHTLADAPGSSLASLKVPADRESATFNSLSRAFPEVTIVRMRDVLTAVNRLLGEVGGAARAMAAVTILSGILVLAGALAATQRQKMADAVILKILGATRFDILKSLLLEYLVLGTTTGLAGAGLGSLAAYFGVTRLMHLPWVFPAPAVAATILASLALTLGFGLLNGWTVLKSRPAEALRET